MSPYGRLADISGDEGEGCYRTKSRHCEVSSYRLSRPPGDRPVAIDAQRSNGVTITLSDRAPVFPTSIWSRYSDLEHRRPEAEADVSFW